MRALLPLALLGMPGAALAQVALPAVCQIVADCEGTTCRDVENGDRYGFDPIEGGVRMTNLDFAPQTMELQAIPGAGTPGWLGRSPRTGGTVLLGLADTGQVALSIHNHGDPIFVYTLYLDCLGGTTSGVTK